MAPSHVITRYSFDAVSSCANFAAMDDLLADITAKKLDAELGLA